MKKLSNDGGDLLYVEGAERSNPSRMSGRSCGFSPLMLVSAGEWSTPTFIKSFETECGPLGQEEVS